MENNKHDEPLDDTVDGTTAVDRRQQIIKYIAIWILLLALFLILNTVMRTVVTARSAAAYQDGYYLPYQQVAGSFGLPTGGGCGDGSGSCCLNGAGGQTAGSSSKSSKLSMEELQKLAINWYAKNYGDSSVTAEVINLGCHQEINIKKGGQVVKVLQYRNGRLSEAVP